MIKSTDEGIFLPLIYTELYCTSTVRFSCLFFTVKGLFCNLRTFGWVGESINYVPYKFLYIVENWKVNLFLLIQIHMYTTVDKYPLSNTICNDH